MDLFLAILIMKAGLTSELVSNQVGVPAPSVEHASKELISYIKDELQTEYLSMTDLDPSSFNPPSDEEEATPADFASINFISKLLYASNYDDEIASVDRIPLDPESDYDKDEMEFIPGVTRSFETRTWGDDNQSVVTFVRNGQVIINNVPRYNSLPTINNPQYVVNEKAFYIDKRPVTNREYRRFIQATGHKVPSHWPEGKLTNAIKDMAVVNVSYDDALAYAIWAKRRIPTQSEFIRAIKFNPSIRLSSPLREWTTTPAAPGKLFAIGSSTPINSNTRDSQTGFRTVIDDQ